MARPKRSLSSRLRHRLDIVRPTKVATGKGGYTTTLSPIANDIAAEVLSLTGSEAVKEKVLRGVRVYRVTIRWRAGVAQTDQLRLLGRYGGELVNIRSAVDPDGRQRELVIHADTEAVTPA